MTNNESARELVLQTLRTRMAFRQAVQRVLKRHNVDMTFEMLQVMNCPVEQTRHQPAIPG